MKSKGLYQRITFVAVVFWLCIGCKKFVTVDPPIDQLNSSLVFDNDQTALAALNGIYSNMMQSPEIIFSSGATLNMGMASDELYYYTPGLKDEFVSNTLRANSEIVIGGQFWLPLYRYIYAANSCIDGATSSDVLSPAIKDQVLGEAYFIRAFCYFYLVNTFGPVPLITQTDYLKNTRNPRTSEADIYKQIIADLKIAKSRLENIPTSVEKSRPDIYAASALLSKTYLFTKDWQSAKAESDFVIGSGKYSVDQVPLDQAFLKGSAETIWQLKQVNGRFNTYVGNLILPVSDNTLPTYLLTQTAMAAFEPGDKRKDIWVAQRNYLGETLFYPFKYKVNGAAVTPITEEYIVFRLAEQYLINAEAKANTADLSGALYDLDIIRTRAGLARLDPDLSQAQVLAAVQQERRVELMAEWGNRWMDLKRTDRADAVLGSLKPTWKSTAELWPVPESELTANPSLLPQNAGY